MVWPTEATCVLGRDVDGGRRRADVQLDVDPQMLLRMHCQSMAKVGFKPIPGDPQFIGSDLQRRKGKDSAAVAFAGHLKPCIHIGELRCGVGYNGARGIGNRSNDCALVLLGSYKRRLCHPQQHNRSDPYKQTAIFTA